MNFLILSVGTRNKIVQYFKRTITDGSVIATDMSPIAPALYEADRHYLVPRITEEGYIDRILEICKKEKISGVTSLIDPELSLLAEHKAAFDAIGVTIIGSDFACCERSLDKYEMYQWLCTNGYHCAKSYMDPAEFFADVERGAISYPVFVKPAKGSASISISKANDRETVELLCSHGENMMIQEFLNGQ
ncbi:MAG: carbamoyl phosphate synthase, partial [Oscillospiraceae bacterium]|nr:carbamoyl phosphate synthase [Oscillospiraceae bacterium]